MLTNAQEKAVRRVIRIGGKLQLPGTDGPVHLHVDRPFQGRTSAYVMAGAFLVCRLGNWSTGELYAEVAARLDELVPGAVA